VLKNKITPLFKLKEKNDIIFIDIEADPKNNNLLQFGAIKLKKNKPFMINWYCKPQEKVSHHILNIIGYDALKKIKMGYPPHEILERIYKLTNNSIFVSFGDFDFNFLNKLSEKYLNKKLNTIFVNFQEEWKNINENLSDISLLNLANIFEIPVNIDNLHDAFFDARLMYQIFRKWEYFGDNWVSHAIFVYNHMQKKFLEKNSIEKANINKDFILFESIVKKVTLFADNKEKHLLKFSMITTSGEDIIENWNMDFNVFFDDDDFENYQHNLITCLRRFATSAKNKTFYIFEHQKNDLIFIRDLCQKYLKKDISNEYFIINGIQHYTSVAKTKRTSNNILNRELVLIWDAILLAKNENKN